MEPLSIRLDLPVREMQDLRERALRSGWEKDWLAVIRPTWEDFSFTYPEGGESNAEAFERARKALETLRNRHLRETIVVATHGNLLVLLLRVVDPTRGFDFWQTLTLPDIYRWDLATDGTFGYQRLWVPS